MKNCFMSTLNSTADLAWKLALLLLAVGILGERHRFCFFENAYIASIMRSREPMKSIDTEDVRAHKLEQLETKFIIILEWSSWGLPNSVVFTKTRKTVREETLSEIGREKLNAAFEVSGGKRRGSEIFHLPCSGQYSTRPHIASKFRLGLLVCTPPNRTQCDCPASPTSKHSLNLERPLRHSTWVGQQCHLWDPVAVYGKMQVASSPIN